MLEASRGTQSPQGRQSRSAGLLVFGAATVLLVVSRAAGALGGTQGPSFPPVCSAWHRGDGDSHSIDLGRIERSYTDLKARLTRSLLGSLEKQKGAIPGKDYDSGLPACGISDRRSNRTEREIPSELLGKTLYFTRISDAKPPALPEIVQLDPGATILATRVDRLEILNEVSRALGRPVALAPEGLAQSLGARCVPALIVISKAGEVLVHEAP